MYECNSRDNIGIFPLRQKRAARERMQKAREETVFQHAGKDPKRADRVYGWGFAQTGALGKGSQDRGVR